MIQESWRVVDPTPIRISEREVLWALNRGVAEEFGRWRLAPEDALGPYAAFAALLPSRTANHLYSVTASWRLSPLLDRREPGSI
jgi:hypothetical protein